MSHQIFHTVFIFISSICISFFSRGKRKIMFLLSVSSASLSLSLSLWKRKLFNIRWNFFFSSLPLQTQREEKRYNFFESSLLVLVPSHAFYRGRRPKCLFCCLLNCFWKHGEKVKCFHMLVSLLSSMCTPLSYDEEEEEKRNIALRGSPWWPTCSLHSPLAPLSPSPATTMKRPHWPMTEYNDELYVTFTPPLIWGRCF